jgi:large subunit ribosomal protein L5
MAEETKQEGGAAEAAPKREKKVKKGKGEQAEGFKPVEKQAKPSVKPRLWERYQKEVHPAMMKEFSFTNPMQVPRLQKIVLNMGLGAAVANPNIVKGAVNEMSLISGQRAVITRAKKAISNFKLREGLPIGCMVTLRGERMWEFLDRLISVGMPRMRDFKGVSGKAFDGRGNYTLGLREQIIFPEIDYDKLDAVKGMNVTITTTAKNDQEGKALLKHLGMPFRN